MKECEVCAITNKSVDIVSTSPVTADTSPIILSQTDLLRFKFLPTLVDNNKEPQKSVSGKLIFEKKPKNAQYFPSDVNDTTGKVSRRSVKVGDWMEIQFDTSETYSLYNGLKQLYSLYDDIGEIPYGATTYARVDSSFRQFLSIIQNDPSAAKMIGNTKNYELVKILLRLITQADSYESLRRSLSDLQDENIQNLSLTLNLEKLQRIAQLMKDNLQNDSEEFWQTVVFQENQWIISQIFASPCTIFQNKAYMGGKNIGNTGGNVIDFIYRNSLSQNVALVEIKTPCTDIIGNQYRGTFSFSYDLSGAISQVLNYKDKLTKEYYALCHNNSEPFKVLSPKCVVIIGKIQALSNDQIAAFENFRNSLSNVIVITFDELYRKITDLIAILSDDNEKNNHSGIVDTDDDELPF